jgi:hypothetical protein
MDLWFTAVACCGFLFTTEDFASVYTAPLGTRLEHLRCGRHMTYCPWRLCTLHQVQVSPVEPDRRLTRHICDVTTASKPNAGQRLFHELPFQEQTRCYLHRSFCLLCLRY